MVKVSPQRDHVHFYGALEVRTGREIALPTGHQSGEITANLEKAASDLEQLQTRVNAARDNLESELARVQDNLARAEQALPGEFQYEYKRMVSAHGADALATVEDETCQGCFQRITPQMYDQLRCGKPIFCMTCGRLLYLPEDTSVAG